MLCPIDQNELVITERQGVEIDYCPKCRGVWLDRGELDKIIDRANQYESAGSGAAGTAANAGSSARDSFMTPRVGNMQGRVQKLGDDYHAERYDEDDDRESRTHKKPKRRSSFFEELFDF